MSFWADRVLPQIVEIACRGHVVVEERQRWIPRARGNVLELGVGSGLNLAFYDPARVENVTGLDPSVPLLARAKNRAEKARVAIELVPGTAEQLPFSDRSFDSAVVTFSLCSIADPAGALSELRRVLRSGGELIFVEHGLAPDRGVQRWQRWLTPLSSCIGGGCRLNRDVVSIMRTAGFQIEELTMGYAEGVSVLSYLYKGIAHLA